MRAGTKVRKLPGSVLHAAPLQDPKTYIFEKKRVKSKVRQLAPGPNRKSFGQRETAIL